MRSALAIAALIFAVDNAAAQTGADPVRPVLQCFAGAARALDDRRSDPASVAEGVVSACSVEILRSNAIMGVNMSALDRDYLRRRMEPVHLRTATEIVLQLRARK